jgi:serine/threonine protein phosphatase PrpC
MDLEDPLVKGLAKETMKWNIVTRVNGELAVARSLGDADYKLGARMSSYEWCYPDRIPRSFTSDVVSNVADTCEIDMQPDDEFMVLACDGLWEVLSPQNVVDLTKAFLKDGSSPEVQRCCDHAMLDRRLRFAVCCGQVAAEKLVDWAIRLGSQDNITAIVVLLR